MHIPFLTASAPTGIDRAMQAIRLTDAGQTSVQAKFSDVFTLNAPELASDPVQKEQDLKSDADDDPSAVVPDQSDEPEVDAHSGDETPSIVGPEKTEKSASRSDAAPAFWSSKRWLDNAGSGVAAVSPLGLTAIDAVPARELEGAVRLPFGQSQSIQYVPHPETQISNTLSATAALRTSPVDAAPEAGVPALPGKSHGAIVRDQAPARTGVVPQVAHQTAAVSDAVALNSPNDGQNQDFVQADSRTTTRPTDLTPQPTIEDHHKAGQGRDVAAARPQTSTVPADTIEALPGAKAMAVPYEAAPLPKLQVSRPELLGSASQTHPGGKPIGAAGEPTDARMKPEAIFVPQGSAAHTKEPQANVPPTLPINAQHQHVARVLEPGAMSQVAMRDIRMHQGDGASETRSQLAQPQVAISMTSQTQSFVGFAPVENVITVPDAETAQTIAWDLRPLSGNGTPLPVQTVIARAELPPQIAHQIAGAMHDAPDQPIEIALNPPELGRVRMVLAPTELGVTVQIIAERSETLDLMRRNIGELGEHLTELGYEEIAFSFGGGHGAGDETQDDGKTGTRVSIDLDPSQDDLPQETQQTRLTLSSAGIDMRL